MKTTMKARMYRNKFSIIIFVAVLLASYFTGISPKRLPNFVDSISNIVSFSSLTTAIFMATLIFVPRLGRGILHKLGTDKKFLERILIVIFLYFITSVLSLFSIIFLSPQASSNFSVADLSLMFAFLSAGISESFYIFYVLFKTN